jgi:type II secretory pathway pseudopilin PulG
MPRRGLTVIEVLVVCGILGLLLALLLPAVQESRATARRLECLNNLKQIGLAIHQYHDAHAVLPGFDTRSLYAILPSLGFPHLGDDRPPSPIRVPTLICPADGSPGHQYAPSNYAMNRGNQFLTMNGAARGPLGPWRLRDFVDGLSQTAVFSELRTFPEFRDREHYESICGHEPHRCVWHLGRNYQLGEEAVFGEDCLYPGLRTAVWPAVHTPIFSVYVIPGAVYSHILPPNSPGCFARLPNANTFSQPASSRHHGGVNLLLGDGHARFVSNGVDRMIWMALGSRDGGESISDF